MPSLLSPTDSPALFSPVSLLTLYFVDTFFLLFGLFFFLTDFNISFFNVYFDTVCMWMFLQGSRRPEEGLGALRIRIKKVMSYNMSPRILL